MTESTSKPQADNPTPHIGAFVLETLTLGMYGDPRHTLREYIQNSFDSIRAAHRTRLSLERGRVLVTITPDQISVLDNGLGIPGAQAYVTLTSVGASKKDRLRDAGFRGIGRLAGMAYCDQLIFRTTFPGETVLSTVTFDCKLLMSAMDPDKGGNLELAELLAEAVTFTSESAAEDSGSHFFEVVLRGLSAAPKSLTQLEEVKDYLAQTAPVDFAPSWISHSKSIQEEYRSALRSPLETIDVFVEGANSRIQIYKPYGNSYSYAKGSAELNTIQFLTGYNNHWWAWVGRINQSAAITDPATRGLRVRVRNIQVDGTDVIENLFAQVKPSYGRFSAYYIGEIHIDPNRVIPNARRDGFEETTEWSAIRSDLTNQLCEPLASDAYEASRARQKDVAKVVEDVHKLAIRSEKLVETSRATYDQVVDLMNTARGLRKKASAAMKIVADLDDVSHDVDGSPGNADVHKLRDAISTVDGVETKSRMLMGQFLEKDQELDSLKARIRDEVTQELLDIVNAFVDAVTYQKIKAQLSKTTLV